jgi:hypothetical protein
LIGISSVFARDLSRHALIPAYESFVLKRGSGDADNGFEPLFAAQSRMGFQRYGEKS